MAYLIYIAAGVGILMFVFKFYLDHSYTFRTQINKLKNEKELLENAIVKFQDNMATLQQGINDLKDQLESPEGVPTAAANSESDSEDLLGGERQASGYEEIPEDPNLIQKRKPKPKPQAQPKTLTEVMLKMKFITQEQATKVEEYRTRTKSPLEDDQIYLMFDYVNPQQIQMAKAILGKKAKKE